MLPLDYYAVSSLKNVMNYLDTVILFLLFSKRTFPSFEVFEIVKVDMTLTQSFVYNDLMTLLTLGQLLA